MHSFSNTFILFLSVVAFLYTPPSNALIAIDPARIQLMKDALSWMTFRRGGVLATDTDVETALLPHIKERYSKSKFYRSFVIAFQLGVLPKLTLQKDQACDPKYVAKYTNPVNQVVTWHSMKKFVFESYQKRNDPSIQYCDYRQGLVCKPTSSKCDCQDGAYMKPISPGSSINRCLLAQGEICALPDFDQGQGPAAYDKRLVTEMIFNLGKPEGCQAGQQCRLLKADPYVYHCQDTASTSPSDWQHANGDSSRVPIDIAQSCSLGVPTPQGSCDIKAPGDTSNIGNAPGYYCYNFGNPKTITGTVSREGFCAHALGSWQVRFLEKWTTDSYVKLWTYHFIQGFVQPRTIPLNDRDLKAFYKRYIDKVQKKVFPKSESDTGTDHQLRINAGEPCNVAKTDKIADLVKYFYGLEEDPPPGSDFVNSATKVELEDHMKDLEAQLNLNDGKFCKSYWSFERKTYADAPSPMPPLKCVKAATPSGNDDGTCQVISDDTTKPYAEKIQMFSDLAWEARVEEENEEKNVDMTIIEENPDPECTPKPELKSRRIDTLDGGGCPPDSVCFWYYADKQGIYDANCDLKTGINLRYECQDTKGPDGSEMCEGKLLNQKIANETELIADHAKLGRGDMCNYQWEQEIREGIKGGQWSGNKIKILTELIQQNKQKNENFCDRSSLLECNAQGVCECVDGTAPRMVTVGGQIYFSDYCYLKDGPCTGLPSMLENLPLTQAEIKKIKEHYGESNSNTCEGGNVCVFVDYDKLECTTDNTGNTGIDVVTVKPEPTEPPEPTKPRPTEPKPETTTEKEIVETTIKPVIPGEITTTTKPGEPPATTPPCIPAPPSNDTVKPRTAKKIRPLRPATPYSGVRGNHRNKMGFMESCFLLGMLIKLIMDV